MFHNPDNSTRKVPSMDYSKLDRPRTVSTRSTENVSCCCSICKIGKLNGLDYKKYEMEMREKPGRPKLKEDNVPVNNYTCSKCHALVGKGMSHSCTRAEMETILV